MNKIDLLIVGKTPPPVGGVSIHISRLIQKLEKEGYKFKHYHTGKTNAIKLAKLMRDSKAVHLHMYNPVLRFVLLILGKILGCKMIFTFHGNVGRHTFLKGRLDRWAFAISNIGVVINSKSADVVSNYKSVRQASAFLAPVKTQPLSKSILSKLEEVRKDVTKLYCAST